MHVPAPAFRSEQAAGLAKWTRWNAWCALGMGVLLALTIVGLPIAWLPLWQGRVLLQSADALDALVQSGNPEALQRALERASFQFVLQVGYYVALALYVGAVLAVVHFGFPWVSAALGGTAAP